MTPTTTAPVAPPPRSREDSAPVLREDPCVVLHGISWETYEALLAELTHSSPRLTYDEGSLQIMTPLFRHENYADALGRLVDILAEELDIDYKAAGSTTFKRRRRKKGFEADRSYYIQHVAAVAGKLEIDLKTDPPPDLIIEVDITSSSIDNMSIYGGLGVPEVWRYDGERFQVWRRQRDGTYRRSRTSAAFPTLPVTKVLALLDEAAPMTSRAMIRSIRAWVRANALRKS